MSIVRKGRKEDLPRVLELIRELAEFENAATEVTLTVEMLERDGFGQQQVFDFIVAESDGGIAGMALFYYRYSTWKGKTLFLEDIIVTKKQRGKGLGKKLFERIILKAREEKCQRLSWQVLDWNQPAIDFYKGYKATFDGEWVNCDLFKDQIDSFQKDHQA